MQGNMMTNSRVAEKTEIAEWDNSTEKESNAVVFQTNYTKKPIIYRDIVQTTSRAIPSFRNFQDIFLVLKDGKIEIEEMSGVHVPEPEINLCEGYSILIDLDRNHDGLRCMPRHRLQKPIADQAISKYRFLRSIGVEIDINTLLAETSIHYLPKGMFINV